MTGTDAKRIQFKGRIVKGIAGFYYVHVPDEGIYECKAKGIFRKDGRKPLVGDDVIMEPLEEDKKGSITELLPRKSELLRPAVANVDQALIVFALKMPEPNFNLLDRFLIHIKKQELPCIICFNKQDLIDSKREEEIKSIYSDCGNQVIITSAIHKEGVDDVCRALAGKTTAVAGPSGVGKSTLLNDLVGGDVMETGAVSEKILRGRHTTRHSELFDVIINGQTTYLMDTPGFSALMVPDMPKEEISDFYPEFAPYVPECKFRGCVHVGEKDCGVKKALSEGRIPQMRYQNYIQIYEECAENEKLSWKKKSAKK